MDNQTMEKYRSEGYNAMQIYQIQDGMDKEVDYKKYENIQFTWAQMEQIKLGLMDDLDVSIYALPNVPAEEMSHIREKMMIDSGKLDIRKQEVRQKKLKTLLMMGGVVLITAVLTGSAFLMKDRFVLTAEDLQLQLTDEEITLQYQQPFQASDYLEAYTENSHTELVLPDTIDTSVLGSQTATYTLNNGVKTVSQNLIVNVVDTEPPVIHLKYEKVTLHSYDNFNGKMFIDSVTDNYDGDLIDSVTFGKLDPDLEKQKIHYSVTDSSGNNTAIDLMVIVDEGGEVIIPEPEQPVPEESEIIDTPEPEAAQSSPSPTPQPPVQQEYEETKTYEENGGTTTCVIHHYSNGTTTESCEWIGPWEEY